MLPSDLDSVAVRVLGSLIEKELSTPDHYPLSLNALTSACNQISNRDPVMSLDESAVMEAVDALRRLGLVRSIQPVGSRVQKFQHLLGEAGDYARVEIAVLGVLVLRGPQTLAEVRTRTARLVPDEDAGTIDATVEAMIVREPEAMVVRLQRRPGQKEVRYAHRLAGEVVYAQDDAPGPVPAAPVDRFGVLEAQVQELRNEVADLRAQLAGFRKQFE